MSNEADGPDDWTTRVTRDIEPPAAVRAHVVAGLRSEGLLREPGGSRSRGQWLRIAAVLVVFAAGWGSASAYHARAGAPASSGSRFMFLLYGETSAPEDVGARVAEYGAWARELREQGTQVSGERLGGDATSIGGNVPAAAQPGGFFIVDAPSAEAARALAAGHPHARHGGTIVVRPIAGT